jgi:hypothetical protein
VCHTTPLEELTQLAREHGRRIFVAADSIDLSANSKGSNRIYVLELPTEAGGTTGGRVGGLGERRVRKVFCYRQEIGEWVKAYETEDPERVERYELPYHAAGLMIILPDGKERVVSGVIDEKFIQAYDNTS